MNRILLLVKRNSLRRALTESLENDYEVLPAAAETPSRFDLGIVDSAGWEQHRESIQSRKLTEAPQFLPFLLIVPMRRRSSIPLGSLTGVDDIIATPLEDMELQMRVAMLLRARNLSLALTLNDDDVQRQYDELEAAQDRLMDTNDELQLANDQKDRFIGMAAHDLRTPLSIISNQCELLLECEPLASAATLHKVVGRIRRSSRFMRGLIDDLLDLSVIESGNLRLDRQPADLVAILREAVEFNQILADQKQIRLQLTAAETRLPISIDVDKIEQVLNNLISNAIKYSHSGTLVELRLIPSDGWCEISVADQGKGIPAAKLDLLFSPFADIGVRGTAGEESTGLGLAIVRRIVEEHGGRLRLQSAEGVGSTFFVTLPRPSHPRPEIADPFDDARKLRLDLDAMRQRFAGKTALFAANLRAFRRSSPQWLQQMREAIAKGEGKALERAAYRLGWELSRFGARAAFETSLDLEKMGREQKLLGAEETCNFVEAEVELVTLELESLLEQKNPFG